MSEAQGHLTQSAPIETQLKAARANTELQRGRVTGAEAAVALAQSQLDATHVVAPADGLLTNLSLHPGVLAAVGTPVALLVPPEVYVVANFKETQIGELRPGQSVTVSVDAFAPRVFEGKVDTIAGGTQGRFSLLPSDNAGGELREGRPARSGEDSPRGERCRPASGSQRGGHGPSALRPVDGAFDRAAPVDVDELVPRRQSLAARHGTPGRPRCRGQSQPMGGFGLPGLGQRMHCPATHVAWAGGQWQLWRVMPPRSLW